MTPKDCPEKKVIRPTRPDNIVSYSIAICQVFVESGRDGLITFPFPKVYTYRGSIKAQARLQSINSSL